MPVPQPEEVLDLAIQLKETRERLNILESRWLAFFSQGVNGSAPPSYPAPPLKSRIVSFLEERPDLSFNMSSVATALNANENSVGPYLSELAKDGYIEKRDRGLYGALRTASDNEVPDDDIPF